MKLVSVCFDFVSIFLLSRLIGGVRIPSPNLVLDASVPSYSFLIFTTWPCSVAASPWARRSGPASAQSSLLAYSF